MSPRKTPMVSPISFYSREPPNLHVKDMHVMLLLLVISVGIMWMFLMVQDDEDVCGEGLTIVWNVASVVSL